MNHDLAQGLVARLLADPIALQAACKGHLTFYAEDDVAVAIPAATLKQLQRFQAFIAKIRHNPLRPIFPLVFDILRAQQAEIDFFMYHTPAYTASRRSGPPNMDHLIEMFITSLRQFLSDKPYEKVARDVALYEHTVWSLKSSAGTATMPAKRAGSVFWKVKHCIVRHRFDIDVVRQKQNSSSCDVSDLVERPNILIYIAEYESEKVDVFEVDEITGVILSLVDNMSSPAEILSRLRSLEINIISTECLATFIQDADNRGLLSVNGN